MHKVFSPLPADQLLLAVRRLSVVSFSLYLLVAPGLGQEDPPPGARQNSLLRQFFRQEYLSFHYSSNETFLEAYVDRRIDHLLENYRKGLGQLKAALLECQKLRQDLLTSAAGLISSRSSRGFIRSFLRVGDEAGRLRKQLSLVFPPTLRYKSDLNPQLDASIENQWLGSELRKISSRVALVERHLDNYFFKGRPVVEVGNLGDRDILVLLFEIRKISRLAGKAGLYPGQP